MRRSRFAKATETNEVRERPSIGDALWFDVTPPQSTDEDALCEWRLAGVKHAPLILGVTHVLIAVACIVLSKHHTYSSLADNPIISASLVTLFDAATAALLLTRNRWSLAPHTIFRILCAYLLTAGLLWTWFGYAIADDVFVAPIAAAPIAMAAGIAMRTIVSISSPPLALVNMLVSIAATVLLAGSPLLPAGVAILSMVLFTHSVVASQGFIATGRKRLHLEAQARKAQHFVDEFESSGRGWFWETDYLGTLSYVSQQLADDFQCEPNELLGRQFTHLLSVHTDASDVTERSEERRV